MSQPGWTTIRVRSIRDRSALIRALFDAGAEGVQELETEIVTQLRRADRSHLAQSLLHADGDAVVEFSDTPDVDWSSEWRSRLRAHRVGGLVVTPPWHAAEFTRDERVVIEPGMAFGTGDHETTRGVLRLLPRVVKRDDIVADVGAGSGVLGIAAARLGARHVFCIEMDPEAIGNAEENVAANGVADRVSVLEGDAAVLLPLVAPVRVVLANIVSGVLIALLPTLDRCLTSDGEAIMSGVLREERDVLGSSLRSAGWRVTASDEEGEWWSGAIARD